MKKLLLIIALMVPGLVLAENRPYVGIATGEAKCSGPEACKGHTNTSKVFVGVRVSPYFAVETGLQKYNDSAVAENAFKFDQYAIGILPISNTVELFGKLGMGFVRTSDWKSSGYLYGAGANFNVTQEVTIRIDIERTRLNAMRAGDIDVTSVTAGLIYNF